MASKGIPENLHGPVREKSGKGFTTREIADWLLEAHEIDVSHVTVARLLERDRKTRAPIAQQIAREELEEQVPADLKRSAEVWDDLDRLQKEAAAVEPKGDDETIANFRLRQIGTQNRILETKRRLLMDRARMAGLVEPDTAVVPVNRLEDLPDDVLERIAALPEPGGAASGGA